MRILVRLHSRKLKSGLKVGQIFLPESVAAIGWLMGLTEEFPPGPAVDPGIPWSKLQTCCSGGDGH